MNAQLLTFPARPRPCRSSARDADLAYIAAQLRMSERPRRAIIDAVRQLVDREGFPPPRSPRFVKGRRMTGAAAVHALSIWDRDQVDDWFGGDLPPAIAASVAGAARAATRHDLQQRALALAGAVA